MSQQIAEFYAKISADSSQFIAEAKKTQSQMDSLSSKLKEAGVSQSAYNKTVADAKQAYIQNQKGIEGNVSAFASLKSGLLSMINPTTLAIGAVTGLAAYLGSASKAAAESAQVDAKLAAVLKSTGNAAGLTVDQLDSMATSLSKLTGVDDEVVKNSEAVLATFTQIGGEIFPTATKAALDMSAVLGGDLQGSVIMIGKALNVAAGDVAAANQGMTALRRSGVSFTEQQKEQAVQLIKNGDVMGYQQLILAELNREFGGAAEGMHEAGDGSDSLKVSLGNLSEYIGSKLLPNIQNANENTSNWIENMLDAARKQDELADAGHRQFEVGKQVVDQYWEGSKATQYYTNEVNRTGKAIDYASQYMRDMNAYFREQGEQSVPTATVSLDQFNASMDGLGELISGKLGPAQEDYNAKIADYKQQLAEAKTAEEKMGITEKINEETEAYNKRANAIIFNIQQQAIMAQIDAGIIKPENIDEASQAITDLAYSYGLVDEKTKAASDATNAAINQFAATGNLEVFEQQLKNIAQGAQESAAPINNLGANVFHTGERGSDAAEGMAAFGDATTHMGEQVSKDAVGPVSALKSAINGLPESGTSWDYAFNISVHGSVPRLPSRGTESGAGAGQANNAGNQENAGNFTSSLAGGGWPGKGFTLVGDMPGGGIGPYTEVMGPNGYIFNNKVTREMAKAGLLGNAVSRYFGGEGQDLPQAVGTMPNWKAKHPKPRSKGTTSTTTSSSKGDEADSVAASISQQIAASIQNSIGGGAAQQAAAISAAAQNNDTLKEIRDTLQALLSKTPSAYENASARAESDSRFS